jgi:acyl-CoA reductase-like NAD-dependent aldehyde dehydrogenase
VILDDADLGAQAMIAKRECAGQVCSSLACRRTAPDTARWWRRSPIFGQCVGKRIDADTQMGPLAVARQRPGRGLHRGCRRERCSPRAVASSLDRGWFIQPTVFGNVTTRRRSPEEIFGPVLSVSRRPARTCGPDRRH